MELSYDQWQGLLRLAVYGIELLLAFSLMLWLRSQHGQRTIPWSYLGQLLGFGALTAAISAIVEAQYVLSASHLPSQPLPLLPLGAWPTFIVLVNSLTEEVAKYAVGTLTILSSPYYRRPSDAIFFLILIGLGFSLIEDPLFLLNPTTAAPLRLIGFYIHSGAAAIIGYYLGQYAAHQVSYLHLLAGVGIAILLHFCYNLTTYFPPTLPSFSLGLLFTLIISSQAFILYRKARFLEKANPELANPF